MFCSISMKKKYLHNFSYVNYLAKIFFACVCVCVFASHSTTNICIIFLLCKEHGDEDILPFNIRRLHYGKNYHLLSVLLVVKFVACFALH